MHMRAICLLPCLLLGLAGCERGNGKLRQISNLPQLYWERACECKQQQASGGDEECRVRMAELEDRQRAKSR